MKVGRLFLIGQYANSPIEVPSKEGNVVADAEAAAVGTHTGRDDDFSAGSRKAAAAGSVAACSRGDARRAAPPARRGAGLQATARPPRRAPAAPSARCRPTAMTTFAAASLRSACLQLS